MPYIYRKICGDKWRFTFIIAKKGRILSGIREGLRACLRRFGIGRGGYWAGLKVWGFNCGRKPGSRSVSWICGRLTVQVESDLLEWLWMLQNIILPH